MVSTVTFERASRIEVEECGRHVGLTLGFNLRLDGCRERDLGRFCVDARSEFLRFLGGYLRMRWCLAGEYVHRGFRLAGEQDVFKGVFIEPLRSLTYNPRMDHGCFFGHQIMSLCRCSVFLPRKTPSVESASKQFTSPVFETSESVLLPIALTGNHGLYRFFFAASTRREHSWVPIRQCLKRCACDVYN